MSDILLLIALVFIFLSIPLLILVIGATAIFGGLYFIQFIQTENLRDLFSANALMFICLLMYFILRKVKRWVRED